MEKQATDFALMASAFSTDEKMARQVCKLLADGDVNETTARKMLKLVADAKLKSEWPWCNLQHYPTWHWNQPFGNTWIACGSDSISVGSTLTAMATNAVSEAA